MYAEAEIVDYTESACIGASFTVSAMTRKRVSVDGSTLSGLSRFEFVGTSGKVLLRVYDATGETKLLDTTVNAVDEYVLSLNDYQLYASYGGILLDITYRSDSGTLTVDPS